MIRVGALLFLLLGMAVPAQAGALGGKLGAQLGYLKARGADAGNVLLGIHGELRYAFVGLRGEVGYLGERRFSVEIDGQGAGLTTRMLPVQLSANVYLPFWEAEPYLILGAGWYRQEYRFSGDSGLEDATFVDPGWHVGAGIEIPVGERFSTYVEWKSIFLDPDYCNTLEDRLAPVDFDSNQFTAGLSWHFP
jgi:hypothetical protein